MTALQQAIKEIVELWSSPSDRPNYTKILEVLESKLEMEKQHIIDAFEIGYENGACVNEHNDFYHGGNYYNETFKSE
jgi:hypothetical protein